MKFFADENVAKSLVQLLRSRGFDVRDVKEENLQGSSDQEILFLAKKENRIIITHDKDFSHTKEKNLGIILLRFRAQKSNVVGKNLLNLLESPLQEKLAHCLTTVSETHVLVQRT